MEALWLENGRIHLRPDLPAPVPKADELLLDILQAGICGTDMEMLRGYAGFTGIPGHEFVGRVIEGSADWLGKRVVASINIGCGECSRCVREGPNHCERREVIGIRQRQGAFAGQMAVPVANALLVPDALDDTAAALVEPLAAALQITAQVTFTGSERVLVLGAGRLAQMIVQVVACVAGEVDVLVRNPARLSSIAPLAVNPVNDPEGQYDLVVEATGNPGALAVAIAHTRPAGTIVLKSTVEAGAEIDLNPLVINEIRLVGSRCGPFAKAIEWLASGRISLDHLNFEHFPLGEYRQAFTRARAPEVYKVLFEPIRD